MDEQSKREITNFVIKGLIFLTLVIIGMAIIDFFELSIYLG